ncbi:hypothetical protein [Nocardia sp. NPDC046763]|uniref:hypothetical protein n=1 Tax=Nocardia sp. NPDC046763 TaxID=3155256 RepID=UPI0033D6C0DF
MVRHRRGWRGWKPFRRTPDPVIAAAIRARQLTEAPTDVFPVYDERSEIYVPAAEAATEQLPIVRGGTLTSDYTSPAWMGLAGLLDGGPAVTQ